MKGTRCLGQQQWEIEGRWVELTIASRPRPPFLHIVAPVFGLCPSGRGTKKAGAASGWLVALASLAQAIISLFAWCLWTPPFGGTKETPGGGG
ncbi:910f697a-5568-4493-81dd-9c037b9d9851 [Sclerotinia trifoliorum]|uniref:910f697a-5568-4493-81dd-9c037b9d9851 n=1 Tax=Sclerotinia trifoliorum TaxID=28548 RepID=A0A8H2W563_9HELO|nr:910f697a-5568-4493-81dd-9c037b9d9851 [Sclerotinia trifoliorum]